MTKAEFFRYCDTCESKSQLKVTDGLAYREHDRAVFLHGVWHRQSIVKVELYRPFPGRQWENRDRYPTSLEAARQKFARWLEEWKARNNTN